MIPALLYRLRRLAGLASPLSLRKKPQIFFSNNSILLKIVEINIEKEKSQI